VGSVQANDFVCQLVTGKSSKTVCAPHLIVRTILVPFLITILTTQVDEPPVSVIAYLRLASLSCFTSTFALAIGTGRSESSDASIVFMSSAFGGSAPSAE
jgi:hypothetical protein